MRVMIRIGPGQDCPGLAIPVEDIMYAMDKYQLEISAPLPRLFMRRRSQLRPLQEGYGYTPSSFIGT